MFERRVARTYWDLALWMMAKVGFGAWTLGEVKQARFSPRTIVDVGAGRGTPRLYEAFPEAYHFLIEPLSEYEPDLRKALEPYRGEYIFAAVGATNTRAFINVEPRPMMSSFLARTARTSTGKQIEKREVAVKTLDMLMEEYGFEPPFGLKIDTEGFEDQVIRGATNFLRRTQFVIAEVSVAERFVDSYTFAEFTELMDENDFFLWDVLGVSGVRFPLTCLDVAFVRRSKKESGTAAGA
jgi:FkbM family methyltransferase